jgi:hypothetical protein
VPTKEKARKEEGIKKQALIQALEIVYLKRRMPANILKEVEMKKHNRAS